MGRIDDLNMLVRLLKEFDLPVSPILEYAIKEKMGEMVEQREGDRYDVYSVEPESTLPRKNPPTTLRVEFPDGTTIAELKAADSLMQTISKIGPEIIESLCSTDPILRPCNVNLVSKIKTSDERYLSRQHNLDNGYYLFTKSSTVVKKQQIDYISKALSLDLRVEIIRRNELLK